MKWTFLKLVVLRKKKFASKKESSRLIWLTVILLYGMTNNLKKIYRILKPSENEAMRT